MERWRRGSDGFKYVDARLWIIVLKPRGSREKWLVGEKCLNVEFWES